MFKAFIHHVIKPGWRLALLGLVVLPLLAQPRLVAAGPAKPGGTFQLYLPLVIDNPCVPSGNVIYGCVEQNGARLSGFSVRVTRFYNNNPMPPAVVAATTTNADGTFEFSNLPPVTGADFYEFGYQNSSNPAQLSYRAQNYNYFGNGLVNLGIWDVTNIPLTGPADGAHITPPQTFSWTMRPSSPSDYDVLVITGYPASQDYYQQPAGHNGSVQLTGLPPELHFGTEYHWFVRNEPQYPYEPILEDSFQTFRVTFEHASQPAPRARDWRSQLAGLALGADAAPQH